MDKWVEYERRKAELKAKKLTSEQYERALRELIKRLNL